MKLLNYAAWLAGRMTPVLICAVALLAIGTATDDADEAGAQAAPPTLAIDLDISDGACTDIDAARTLNPGDPPFQAAVCFSQSGTDTVAALNYRITYNDAIIQAANVCEIDSDDPTPPPDCSAPALEYNPDANQGTEFSTPGLGGGWDCSGGVGAFPQGDVDAISGNGTGEIYSGGCSSAGGPNTLVQGPLGVITFTVVGGGTTALTFGSAGVTGNAGPELGSCNPTVDIAMTCTGASVTVGGAPVPTATFTNTPGPTNTPGGPTNTPTGGGGGGATSTPVTNSSSSTPTPTRTGEATAAPGTTVPGTTPPPGGGPAASATRAGTGRPGSGVTGPDTGDGTGAGGSGASANLMLLAASGAVLLAAGAGVAWRRRSVRVEE